MKTLFIFVFTLTCSVFTMAADDIELRKNKYDAGLLPLGTGYQARLFCSCTFVMKRDEEYCHKFVEVSPKIFRVKVDQENKTVEARALYFFAKSMAQWTPEQGCVLQ